MRPLHGFPALRPRLAGRLLALTGALALLAFGPRAVGAEPPPLEIESSLPKLDAAFRWAVAKALSYVQTGRTGVVDGHEQNRAGTGRVAYIPSYWAGYTWRTAFYARDFCHQADGAHLLGLAPENLSMLRAFARSATPGRRGYPLWALNFDGSPFKLDYHGDDSFVREVPAVFELVEQCHRQFLWTADRAYLDDPDLRAFAARAVTEFIAWHDARRPNGVAEGDGSGDIFRGCATYNEIRSPLIEAGDGIACEYQALLAWSRLLAARGERAQAKAFAAKADRLQSYFNTTWGVQAGSDRYVRGYNVKGEALTDFGRENSWFMPMKFITRPSAKTDACLDFIAHAVETPEGRPPNLEAISYLPGVFLPYHRVEEGWRWLEYIIDQRDREYPEISYTLVSHVVTGLLGVEPNAPEHALLTIAHLPRAVTRLGVRRIPVGAHRVDVTHEGGSRSTVTHAAGPGRLHWTACFDGDHATLRVNGRSRRAQSVTLHGRRASSVLVHLAPGSTATVEVAP